MYPPPEIRTSNAELVGTTAGIILTFVVATVALAILIGGVYWASAHPEYKRRGEPRRPPQEMAEPVLSGHERISVRPGPEAQAEGSADDDARPGGVRRTSTATQPAAGQRRDS
jgi:hypothetical protein